jgi:predicted TIM-barrel fold metal-dependent hydrolase
MNLSYEDEGFDPWWSFGNAHRLYSLMHVAGHTGGVKGIGRLAERYPDMSWLIAHSGGSYAFAEEVAACIVEHPNVYAEITLTPMRDPRQQLGWVLWADLSPESKEKILGANFKRIIDRALK